MINHLLLLMLWLFLISSHDQLGKLDGEYKHKLNDFYSTYTFTNDRFVLVESGDLGTFYGEGAYRFNDTLLILKYDTLQQLNGQVETYFTTKADTLIVLNLSEKGFDIKHSIEKRAVLQHYRKMN